MKSSKDTTSVLIHVSTELYKKYLHTLTERSLKRQSYNSKVFAKAIKNEIEDYSKLPKD
jgi:hypothetical protein